MLSRVSIFSGRLQGVVALLPVTRAQLVGLQRIKNAQHLLGTATHVHVSDVHEADDPVRVDDEGGTLCDAGLRVEDPESACELALDVREHRERQVLQLFLLAPPRQVHELAVDAGPEQLRVTRAELLFELAEGGDLGGADEGEVLGPKEHDLPLAGKALVDKGLERLLGIARDDAGEGKPGETVAYA